MSLLYFVIQFWVCIIHGICDKANRIKTIAYFLVILSKSQVYWFCHWWLMINSENVCPTLIHHEKLRSNRNKHLFLFVNKNSKQSNGPYPSHLQDFLQSSPLHNQLSQTLWLHNATIEQNDCFCSISFAAQRPWKKVRVNQAWIKV